MALEPARTSVQVTICSFAVDDQEPGLGRIFCFCANTPWNCWGHILQIHSLSLLTIFIRNIPLPLQVWSFRIDIHRQPSGDPATIDRPIIPDNETRNQMSSICPRLAYHLLSGTHLHLKRAIFQWHGGGVQSSKHTGIRWLLPTSFSWPCLRRGKTDVDLKPLVCHPAY